MKVQRRDVPPWIKLAFAEKPKLCESEYLMQAIESDQMTESRWAHLHRLMEESNHHSAVALQGLAWVLEHAVTRFTPESQLTAKQKAMLAEKVSQKAQVLANELAALSIHWDWGDYRVLIRDRMIERVQRRLDKAPAGGLQRTLPIFRVPELREGWKEGVHATVDELPDLLQLVAIALKDWSLERSNDEWVSRPNNPNARRTYFFKVLTNHFFDLYGTPCRETTLALGSVFFPDAPAIDTARLAELAPSSKKYR